MGDGKGPCLGHFAWCPRFASVFWTLTWAEEGSGGPAQHFQLTISACPLRLDLHHSVLPESIVPEAAPLPVSRFLHQSAFHGIAMHIARFLDALLRRPHIEIVIARLRG